MSRRNVMAKLRNIQDYIVNTDSENRKCELIQLREEIIEDYIKKQDKMYDFAVIRADILCELHSF